MSGYVYKSGQQTSYGANSSGGYVYGGAGASSSNSTESTALNAAQGVVSRPSGSLQVANSVSVSAHSTELVRSAIHEGALCPAEDLEMLKQVKEVAKNAFKDVQKNREQINRIVEDFNGTVPPLLQKIMAEAGTLLLAQDLEEKTVGRLNFIMEYAPKVFSLANQTARQQIEVVKLSREGALTEYQGVIDLVFHARFKEVDLLAKRLEVLQGQENHQLKIFTALQELKMREETQRFDQMIKIAGMQETEREGAFQRVMIERKQVHSEKIDFKKLDLDKYKIEVEKDIAEYQSDNLKEVEMHRTNQNAQVEMQRIDADSRARMAEAAASASKCSIM